MDLNKIHELISDLLDETDEVLVKTFFEKQNIEWKTDSAGHRDILTETDQKIESFLKNELKKTFPSFGFIGEEEKKSHIKEYNWIVDPIDGTKNFAAKVPVFGTSIALWKGNTPLYGILSFPMQVERLHAIKSKGAFLNDEKVEREIFERNSKDVLTSMITSKDEKKNLWLKIIENEGLPRGYGTVCYNAMMTILGKAKGLAIINLAIWDIAAFVLIAQEIGIKTKWISDFPDIFDKNAEDYRHSLFLGEVDERVFE